MTLPSPLDLMGSDFGRVTIVGVGLIGGSIGLRMKSMEHPGIIIGHDQPEVLDEALQRGAIDSGCGDLTAAVADADLVVLATPADVTLRLLPHVLKAARADTVVTDTVPAKVQLAKIAADSGDLRCRWIGGHPLAGSPRQGIGNADANLFDNAYWLFCPAADTPPAVRESISWWARLLGAYPLLLEAELHDRIMAATSHVPFVLALALSDWIARDGVHVPLLPKLATGNFQTMTATAGLPLGVWEGVLRANKDDVLAALKEFRKELDTCIGAIRDDRLEDIWQRAHALQRKLQRERPGDWDANCELVVTAPDRPGTLAKIAGLLAAHDISIRDIHVIYIRERRGGTLQVVVESRLEARRAIEILTANGYAVRMKD